MAILKDLGQALYGRLWIKPVAKLARTSRQNVYNWASGVTPTPEHVIVLLKIEAREHVKTLQKLLDNTPKPD